MLVSMQKAQVKEVGEYLKNLEDSLNSQDSPSASFQTELPKLYETIKLLMDETFKTKDQDLKSLLAYMELRLRTCREIIEGQLGIRN